MSEELSIKVETKGSISIRKALRALGLLGLIFVFCPSFMVSCSGETVKINAFKALTGVKFMEEKVEGSSHPLIALVLILVPILVIALTCLKNKTDKTVAGYIMVSTVVDLVVWYRFKAVTQKLAEDNLCEFEKTGWYTVSLIVMFAILVLAVMVLAGMKKLDNVPVEPGSAEAIEPAADASKFCAQCGAKLEKGAAFCGSCGTKVE